jgi:hypothetical protein
LTEANLNSPAWAHRADTLVPAGECGLNPCLFGLAPCGVYHAAVITDCPVRSYRTFSPLPSAPLRGNCRRYILCCTGRLCALKHTSRTLSGTLPCGVRTFLPLPNPCGPGGSDHPAACILILQQYFRSTAGVPSFQVLKSPSARFQFRSQNETSRPFEDAE